jgi:chromate reductase
MGAMTEPLMILGIPGSLRRASMNRGLLRAAQETAPDGVTIDIYDLNDIPLFNADVEAEGLPPAVHDFKERIRAADALLFATPEYNYSFTGVLKNAIDWASRPTPPPGNALRHKPAAMMGAGGGAGTGRAQLALRHVFINTETYIMGRPELVVQNARTLFDEHGELLDETVRERVGLVVEALVAWTHRLRRGLAE